MSKCFRCKKDLKTGDKYAVEKVAELNHRFYHQLCIKKDPATKARSEARETVWVDYPVLTTGGRRPLYENRAGR